MVNLIGSSDPEPALSRIGIDNEKR